MLVQKIFDVRNVILVTIASIAILQFGVFSLLGLAIYGLLLVYNLFSIIYNLREKKLYVNIVFFLGTFFCIYFLISSVANGNIADVGSTILQYLLIFVIASFIRGDDSIKKDIVSLSKVLTIAGLSMAVLSILLALTGEMFPSFFQSLPEWEPFTEVKKRLCNISQERLVGFGGNPLITAYYCYTCLLFSIYLCAVECSKRCKILAYLNILISSITIIFFTRSRTHIVSLFAFLFFYGLIFYFELRVNKKARIRSSKYIIIFLAVFIVIFALFIFSHSFREFILNEVIRVQSLSTLSNRLEIFYNSYNVGIGHRWFGVNAEYFEKTIGYHTHNAYLEALTFGGLPCLILFLLYLLFALITAIADLKSKDKDVQIIACFIFSFIIGYMVGGITEPGGVRGLRLIFPVMQILIAWGSVLHHNILSKSSVLKK